MGDNAKNGEYTIELRDSAPLGGKILSKRVVTIL